MNPQRTDWARLVVIRVAVTVAIAVLALLAPASTMAQPADGFAGLTAGQRVYDETGTSLTPPQVTDLTRRLDELGSTGADAVVYVRALDATSEETLDQVEALQQAWVAQTGTDQDTAVAILINRNPDDPNDARAGVFVGKTFTDGNVPPDEQRAIVSDALIPPLRDGDVHASLAAGLDRLTSSIRNGPPQNAFESWAADAGRSWLPWTEVGVALLGLVAALLLFRRRATTDRPDQEPTTTRPGDLSPALAGALATGVPQASAIPAVILDLAARDALAIEPESTGGRFSKPTVQIRVLTSAPLPDKVEQAVWVELQERAKGGVVSSKELTKLSQSSKQVRDVVEQRLREEGWLNPNAAVPRAGLLVIGIVAAVLAVFTIVVAAAGGQWVAVVGIVAFALLFVTAVALFDAFSRLSRAGQETAIAWKAYRKGLKKAAKDDTVALDLDLDAVLPDVIAVNLGSDMKDRLEKATSSGTTLRAFTSSTERGGDGEMLPTANFPWWIAFSRVVSASNGSTGGAVSGGGAGGGGGAAGST